MTKSPINWFGGKYYMANDIIELFPSHKIYVEVFGGAAHILFKKDPSPIEVYNDIDNGLVDFFKILRDEKKSLKLKFLLDMTPYSREEFYRCRDSWRNESDEIEKARMWYVSLMQSFSCNFQTWSHSKSISRRGMSQTVSRWLGNIEENIPNAINRFKSVQVENMDYKDILKKYDNEDTLFYLDPPYIHDTRKMTYEYEHEIGDNEQSILVNLLLKIRGKCILSGYDHPLYNKLSEGQWKKIRLGNYAKRSEKTDLGISKSLGEEFVWINY